MNILLEQEGDKEKEIEIDEKTSEKFDLKCRTNLFETGFMASFSFSKFAEDVREKRGSP